MADSGEAFGEDVDEPAPYELVRMKPQDAGFVGITAGPLEEDVTRSIVAYESLSAEGAALDVAG